MTALEEEVGEHVASMDGEINLRVELHSIQLVCFVREACNDASCFSNNIKALGNGVYRVSVREQDLLRLLEALEERA